MTIKLYNEGLSDEWDKFVLTCSVNGNFLQSRRFLSYHPEGRFSDSSLLYYDDKGNLRGVIPGAVRSVDGHREFVSHPGSTYGGIVLDAKTCSAKRLQKLIDELVFFLRQNGFDAADLRFPPDFMWSRQEASLVEYLLRLNGFSERVELTTYIDFSNYKEPVVSNFSQGKRTNVNNCKKRGLRLEILSTKEDVRALHGLLTANLKKHDAEPVHTVDEMWDLYASRLAGRTEMLGVFDGSRLVAAGWLFLFENMKTAHTQYLCADEEYSTLSPMTYLYYSSIEYCKSKGYRYLSWGISTEESGSVLNWGLTESKEHFGSLHGVHRSFEIALLQ